MTDENTSPWLHEFDYSRKINSLRGNLNADVVILGGGISGVLTAYTLLKYTERKVTIIEGGLIAHGATGHNAGYVVADFEKPFTEIVQAYGLNIARNGLKEVEDALGQLAGVYREIGLEEPKEIDSTVTYTNFEHFLHELHQEYLKYGKLKKQIFVSEKSNWMKDIPENFLEYINIASEEEFNNISNSKIHNHKCSAIILDRVLLANSANFTEKLADYLLKNYSTRFEIFEKSFVNQIRLLHNSQIILDSLYGVCICDKLVLCTNGFENFGISGPLGREVDKNFHHSVSGLIGYMTGTFVKEDKLGEIAGVFFGEEYNHKNIPEDAGPYIYYTNRKFRFGTDSGHLFTVGGPEIKLKDRKVYKNDHLVDKNIYLGLEKFQNEYFNVEGKSHFKWHGLMGYTKTGIRIVGRDKLFQDLFYNLGCNGIGISTAVSGAFRIAKLFSGEKLERSIFDPK